MNKIIAVLFMIPAFCQIAGDVHSQAVQDPIELEYLSDWDPFAEKKLSMQESADLFEKVEAEEGNAEAAALRKIVLFNPPVNWHETPNEYILHLNFSGIDLTQVTVRQNGRELILEGPNPESPDHFSKVIRFPFDAAVSRFTSERHGQNLVIKVAKKDIGAFQKKTKPLK